MVEAEEIQGRSGCDNAAGLKQDDAGSEEKSFAKIVGDEDDGLAETASKGAEFALKLGAGDGIEGTEGFIHQENGRIGGKGAGDANALTLAAGKFAGAAVGKFRWIKSDHGEELPDAHGDATAIPLLKRGDEGDVFRNGEMRKETGFLDDVTNAAAEVDGVPFSRGTPLDEDLALRGK